MMTLARILHAISIPFVLRSDTEEGEPVNGWAVRHDTGRRYLELGRLSIRLR